ncbi:MAG: hypothetical protein JWL85_810, partial [Candidatus Saccharibacteria bacterium]|nr:hypothetical protein [Candidatus Saccharibacteria bacterium]
MVKLIHNLREKLGGMKARYGGTRDRN